MLWQGFGRWGGLQGSADGGSGLTTDPHWANVKLLMGFNGTEPTNGFPDESSAAHGDATDEGANYDNTNKVFGSASIAFDSGLNDYIWYADHADWTLGTSDFTLECFVRFSDVSIDQVPIAHFNTVSNQRGWYFHYAGGFDLLQFAASSTGGAEAAVVNATFDPVVDTWYYICAERSGNTFRIYAGEPGGNATMLSSASDAIDIFDSSARLTISGTQNAFGRMYGNIDELRYTVGTARYATDTSYAVPSTAFPRS